MTKLPIYHTLENPTLPCSSPSLTHFSLSANTKEQLDLGLEIISDPDQRWNWYAEIPLVWESNDDIGAWKVKNTNSVTRNPVVHSLVVFKAKPPESFPFTVHKFLWNMDLENMQWFCWNWLLHKATRPTFDGVEEYDLGFCLETGSAWTSWEALPDYPMSHFRIDPIYLEKECP